MVPTVQYNLNMFFPLCASGQGYQAGVSDPHFCLASPNPGPKGQNAEFLHKNFEKSLFVFSYHN
jgi:hypothetical protein